MSETTLTVTVAQSKSKPVTEEAVFDVLKHLSPVPKVTTLRDEPDPVFCIILENRRLAQKAFLQLTSNFSVLGKPDIKERLEHQTTVSGQRITEGPKSKMIKLGPNIIDDLYNSSDNDRRPGSFSNVVGSQGRQAPPGKTSSGWLSGFSANCKFAQPKSQVLSYNSYKTLELKSQPKSEILARPKESPHAKARKQADLRFVKVDNLDTASVDSSILFNLVGTVGNVAKLMFNTKRGFAIVELENASQAELACQYLHDMPFFGSVLSVSVYEPGINWADVHVGSESDIRIISGNSKYYRYKPNLKIKVNKLSRLLHVTNVSADLSLSSLCTLVSEVCEPNLIHKLESKGKKSNMYVIEFDSEKDSLEVLCTLHDKLVSGLRLKMSFSHMKMNHAVL